MNPASAAARRYIRCSLFVAAGLFAAITACTNTTDPATSRAITELTGPTATVNVAQGFDTKTLITIKRSSAFDGVVQLTAQGLPQGMVVSFSPPSLSSLATLSEMTVVALSTLAPGAHSFTVRASSDGVESRMLTVSVMVTVPSITVAASSATANVAQGSTQAIPITIAREGGFTGIVGLSVLGLPTGVTGTFSPQAIESGATTSTLTLAAPLTAQTGVTTVTLRASSQGLADKTLPIEVTVAPATTPAILMSASPVLLQVDGGQSAETTLTLQRFAGFAGAVNVSVDGLPATLTATPIPFGASANTTTLRINVSDQEIGGTYQLTVRANGTGIQEATTRIAVQTRAQPQFGLTFSGTPNQTTLPVTINRGANTTVGVRIVRVSEYNLPVALTATGAPSGVTTNLPTTIPSSTVSQNFDITIGVAANAIPGVYNIALRGQAPGFTRDLTLELTVK